jgi:hypothetical protein
MENNNIEKITIDITDHKTLFIDINNSEHKLVGYLAIDDGGEGTVVLYVVQSTDKLFVRKTKRKITI